MRSKTKRRFEVNQRTAQPPVPGGTFWRKKKQEEKKRRLVGLEMEVEEQPRREKKKKVGRERSKSLLEVSGIVTVGTQHSLTEEI